PAGGDDQLLGGDHGGMGMGDAGGEAGPRDSGVPFFPLDAGCPACIDSGLCMIACNQNHPTSIAVDGTHIYWTNKGDSTTSFAGGGVMQMDKSGSNLMTIAGPLTTRPRSAIVASDGCVYWFEGGAGNIRKSCGGTLSTVVPNLGDAIPKIATARNT